MVKTSSQKNAYRLHHLEKTDGIFFEMISNLRKSFIQNVFKIVGKTETHCLSLLKMFYHEYSNI